MNMNGPDLIADFIFGLIGSAAFIYGWKQKRLKTTLISIALMGYSYFVSGTLLLYGLGIVLTVALFTFTD